MSFNSERDFENNLIAVLTTKGWNSNILKNYDEKQLIENWAKILFENNRNQDRLGDFPLTNGEMQQIIEQINKLKTPLKLNEFINGKTVAIIRDNQDDHLNFGKTVNLRIYDRQEIAGGTSRYQIVQQPKFSTSSRVLNDRRGDLMLLINGMPVIHIELKKSGVPISQAQHQIETYSRAGVFTGLFALVQIFVAMNPEEATYFANPGSQGKFNPDYYFHWADFDNAPINNWKDFTTSLLSIPMAHQLIGFYTVADDKDGVLKVMRSYQYYAAHAISDKVAKTKWEHSNLLGGYIYHTTGSGKTMTSFKAAQLIATSKDADKVVFLVDRIELGTQSLEEYQSFATGDEAVQATKNTIKLVEKLKSTNPANTLIVTSIQKMSNIKDEADGGMKTADIEIMNKKRVVFILDECHRNAFGDMLLIIKQTFPKAIFFGFTGTPIFDVNMKKKNTMSDVLGNELHRYCIADGIRDKNVLGFDTYKVLTYKDNDLKTAVALEKTKAKSVEEVYGNSEKEQVFYKYFDLPMAGTFDQNKKYTKGIEDDISNVQYKRDEHRQMVVNDILENWIPLSHNHKFHAILATSSIPEAIEYYRLFKSTKPNFKVTALFDPTLDNCDGVAFKEDGLVELIEDYNERYNQSFKIPNFAKMKKDIASRLAHKKPYERVENTPEMQIDLLIVVDQMLTGFDSKWLNTLYLDKMLEYENIIQAFSRTNRLFGHDKPFGTIKYYRRPHTMEVYIQEAIKTYAGEKPFDLFVNKLGDNLHKMNAYFQEIQELFSNENIVNFLNLPEEPAIRKKFASLFNKLNDYLEAAKIQGFVWSKLSYNIQKNEVAETITLFFDEVVYKTLLLRYKELFIDSDNGEITPETPYEIKGYLTTIDTADIDNDYMNSRFTKYIKLLESHENPELKQAALDELHKTFATLSSEEQKFANIFLHDIQRGDVQIETEKTLRDYITEYMIKAKDDQIHRLTETLELDERLLRNIMAQRITPNNIDEHGRFTKLKATVNKTKAKAYFEKSGTKLPPHKVTNAIHVLLRDFILKNGFDLC